MRASLCLSLLLALTAACAHPPLHPSTLHLARESPFIDVTVHDCYDGDTCNISLSDRTLPPIFGQQLPIRLRGINAWELKGRCPEETALAKAARDFLKARLSQGLRVDVADVGRDKYFRLLGYLIVDGRNLSTEMLTAGHALPYNGGTKPTPPCSAPAG